MKSAIIKSCARVIYDVLSIKNLDNCIDASKDDPYFRRKKSMAKINRHVVINGETKWIRAKTEQEYADKLAELFNSKANKSHRKHNFSEYAQNWFKLYSEPNVERVTSTTYKRQIDKYLIPSLGEKTIEDITISDVQAIFNAMDCAKSTKAKVKTVLNMIFETAIDDGIITRNPLRSKRLRITGSPSKSTEAYSVQQMRVLISRIPDVIKPEDRTYLALQALHPMRLEEVLGLKWEDIDFENMIIHIRRAVTHPTRNMPEIKETKTEASKRTIALSAIAYRYLIPGNPSDFVLGGKEPFSYQKVKKVCERIQKDTNFDENVTPIRFRTTVLTDIYDQTKDVKAAQAAAGHTTAAMTLKHYVKGREKIDRTSAVIDSIYGD